MTGCILLVLFLAVTGPLLAADLEGTGGGDAVAAPEADPRPAQSPRPEAGPRPVTIAVMDFWSLNCPAELVQEFRRRIRARILWHERADLHVVMVSSSDEDFRNIEGPPSFAALGLESYNVELARARSAQYILTGQIITALDGIFISLHLYSIHSSGNVWDFSSRCSDSTALYNQVPVIVSSLLTTDLIGPESEPRAPVPEGIPDEAKAAPEPEEPPKDHEFYRAVGITAGNSLRADFLDGSTISALSIGLTGELSSIHALDKVFPGWLATQAGFGFGIHYLFEAAPDFGGSHELQAILKVLLPIGIDYFTIGGAYALRWQGDETVRQLGGFTFSPLYLSSWDFYPVSFELLPTIVLYDFNDESWKASFKLLRIAVCLEW